MKVPFLHWSIDLSSLQLSILSALQSLSQRCFLFHWYLWSFYLDTTLSELETSCTQNIYSVIARPCAPPCYTQYSISNWCEAASKFLGLYDDNASLILSQLFSPVSFISCGVPEPKSFWKLKRNLVLQTSCFPPLDVLNILQKILFFWTGNASSCLLL